MSIIFTKPVSAETRENTEWLFSWIESTGTQRLPLPTMMRGWIEDGTVDINAKDSNGNTLLKYPIKNGSIENVRTLLDNGADVNLAGDDEVKLTPLHLAVNYHRYDICELLLERGADVNARDSQGNPPMEYAENLPILKLLVEHHANVEARGDFCLIHSLAIENTEAIRSMLDYTLQCGVNLTIMNSQNETLHEIAKKWNNKTFETTIARTMAESNATWNAWQDGSLTPDQLTSENVAQLLHVWPVTDPKAEVPRFLHLDAIFSDPRWQDEHATHKLELVRQVPGLTTREQMFLMGGHVRAVIQKQNAGKEVER